MDCKLVTSAKGIWIFIDGRHRKTIPKKYLDYFENVRDKLSFDKKRLTESERLLFENLLFSEQISDYKESIKVKDKHLFRMIENSIPVGARFVNSKNGDRYELKFDNKIFVKIPRKIYTASPIKLEEAFLNY